MKKVHDFFLWFSKLNITYDSIFESKLMSPATFFKQGRRIAFDSILQLSIVIFLDKRP